MSEVHELKTHDTYFDAVQRKEKTFEVRRDDRGFQKGDIIRLIRMKKNHNGLWEVDRDGYSASRKIIEKKVTYILTGGQFGIEPGYVVLGFKP